jgi:hypothetical protein
MPRDERGHGGRNVPRHAASRGAGARIRRPGPEEDDPDDGEDQDRKPGRDGEQRRHRRPWLALARLGRSFHDAVLLSRGCHGDLDLWLSLAMAATPRGYVPGQRVIPGDVPDHGHARQYGAGGD